MKPPDGYDLDAEIAKYGGRIPLGMSPLGAADKGAPAAATLPFDLDAELSKYGGHVSPQSSARASAEDPLAALHQFDPSSCSQVQVFAKALGASVDIVVPRGAPDPSMAGGMSWPRWERRRLDWIFREGRSTLVDARAQEEEKKAERAAWLQHWRKIQRGWAKWQGWHQQFPKEANDYRRQHQDADGGDQTWLLEFASMRVPPTRRARTTKRNKEKQGG